MGYNLEATYSDLVDLEEGGIATVGSGIFGKDSLEGHKTKGANFVDLNLGSFGEAGKGLRNSFNANRAPLMESFSAGSSKRSRALSGGGHTVSCLVDGCKSDLSKCRDYHRRHKVCEMHSKSPKVTIGGHEQRFCQQCSRFHSLGEFDEGKRSCRKRLEGHNRRRRKPQPEPLPVKHGSFLSANEGSRYLPFSNQTMIPASAVVSTTTWSGGVKAESNPSIFNSSVSVSYFQAYRGSRQFPFLQGTDSPLSLTGASSSSAGHTLHHDPSSSPFNSGSNRKSSNNGLIDQMMDSNHHHHQHQHRALSLLSSSPFPAEVQTPEMGLDRIIQTSPINPPQPIINGLYYNHSIEHFPGLEGQAGNGNSGSAIMSNTGRSNNNSLCQDVFQSGPDGSSATATATAAHQTLSFSWD